MHSERIGGSDLTLPGAVSVLVLVVGLGLTVADVPFAWLVWPLGYGVALPLTIRYATASRDADRQATRRAGDPVAGAKRRYVDGEIDERELERLLDAELELGGKDRRKPDRDERRVAQPSRRSRSR